jgi:hypothetical protein
MKQKDEIINEAINRLSELTGEDFHGYRSEIWNVLSGVMNEQDRNTRHSCAEAVLKCLDDVNGQCIWKDDAHSACMNAQS